MLLTRIARWPEVLSRWAAFTELLSDGIQFSRTIARSRAALGAEVLFWCKQLAYYQEREIRLRRLTDAARLSLVLWSRFFDWKESLAVVTPETFIRWHRKGFKFYWRWKSRGGRPALPRKIRQLIVRMVKENITWGEERIADELSLKLGIWVSPRTMRKYWPKESGAKGRREPRRNIGERSSKATPRPSWLVTSWLRSRFVSGCCLCLWRWRLAAGAYERRYGRRRRMHTANA